MLPRMPQFPRLLALVCFALCPVASQAVETPAGSGEKTQNHLIQGLGKDSVELDESWAFHLGDDPAWASPSFDDSQWGKISAGKTWGAQGYYSYTGFGWYRYHLSIAPVVDAPKELALLIPGIDDSYEIYWNGTRIGKNGELPPSPDWYISQPPQTYGLGQLQSGVLAVRVWKAPLASNDPGTLGGFEGAPVLGGSAAIAARKAQIDFKWLRSNQFFFGLNSLYALVGLLSLLAWWRDRKQWLVFCMAGYTLMQVAGTLLGGLRIPWPFGITVGLLQPVLMIQDISLWFLLVLLYFDGHFHAARGFSDFGDHCRSGAAQEAGLSALGGRYLCVYYRNDICRSECRNAICPVHALDAGREAECAAVRRQWQSHFTARSCQYTPAALRCVCGLQVFD